MDCRFDQQGGREEEDPSDEKRMRILASYTLASRRPSPSHLHNIDRSTAELQTTDSTIADLPTHPSPSITYHRSIRHQAALVHLHPAGSLLFTHSTHCFCDLGLDPPHTHALLHLQDPLQMPQSACGHALAIASFICSIVIVPQPQLAGSHLHTFSANVHVQSAQVAQPQLKEGSAAPLAEGGAAALADMTTGEGWHRHDGKRQKRTVTDGRRRRGG